MAQPTRRQAIMEATHSESHELRIRIATVGFHFHDAPRTTIFVRDQLVEQERGEHEGILVKEGPGQGV